jgi:hypothetical protein
MGILSYFPISTLSTFARGAKLFKNNNFKKLALSDLRKPQENRFIWSLIGRKSRES